MISPSELVSWKLKILPFSGAFSYNVQLGPSHHSTQLVSPALVHWMVLTPLVELTLLFVSPLSIWPGLLCTHSAPKREGLAQAGPRASTGFVVLATSLASLCFLRRVNGQGHDMCSPASCHLSNMLCSMGVGCPFIVFTGLYLMSWDGF